ncbi:ABC transporter ATP-binding protein [Enterovirga sp.]|uniref:energy-coupling factor ABC transporter ATP-binding protein n=1 Tax=Enterovirga sp. TaxID=2026350 RepID=UPI00261A158A|nr:ABC transporter ATP-binding protein [Enterovirga sp.]MDB5591219.1 Biotin transport ATP-binding protein BioM [Enterovirga sp.]
MPTAEGREAEPPRSTDIRFENVHVTLGERAILRGVDCRLAERRVAVLGANGSGKSTLVRLINGLAMPTAGRVVVGGLDTRTDLAAIRRRVGHVFQNPDSQIVLPIVEEDLAFGLRNLGYSQREARSRARLALDSYGLGGLAEAPAHTLSGGEKQLVALLGVLVMRPDLIVFDEPTTLLDLRNRNRIAAEIRDLAQSAVVATHDLDLIRDFDRALVLDHGRIVVDDAPGPAVAWYRANLS